MQKLRVFLISIAAAVGLSACAGVTGTGPTTGTITGDITVAQVQSIANTTCGFLPTVATVAKIIASFAGASDVVDVVSQAATAICGAVTKPGLRRGAVPVARGVAIRGQFTR